MSARGAARPDRAPPGPGVVETYRVELDGEEYLVVGLPMPRPVLDGTVTGAEAKLIDGVLAGKTNGQIAAERGTATRTVANQLQTLYRKLGVGSRGELRRRLLAR